MLGEGKMLRRTFLLKHPVDPPQYACAWLTAVVTLMMVWMDGWMVGWHGMKGNGMDGSVRMKWLKVDDWVTEWQLAKLCVSVNTRNEAYSGHTTILPSSTWNDNFAIRYEYDRAMRFNGALVCVSVWVSSVGYVERYNDGGTLNNLNATNDDFGERQR